MITDLLARVAMIRREVPEEHFHPAVAAETAVDTVDREVSEEEREELLEVLPEWLEGSA